MSTEATHHWLVKQEPSAYAWEDFVEEGGTAWTGVRNFQARNNLRGMKRGDSVLFYHSGDVKAVVGLARVAKGAYPDPTASEGDWSAVDLVPVKALARPVTLQTMKQDSASKKLLIFRNTRLSVAPLTKGQFRRILELSGSRL